METMTKQCAHTCRNTCAMLIESLRRETSMIQFYEEVMGQCDDPVVNSFVKEIVEARAATVDRIVDKLNQITVRSEILNGISSSFENPA